MNKLPIKTSLLTIGNGAITNKSFEALRTFSDLQGVILSQRAKKANKYQRILEYGAWYTAQQVFTQLHDQFLGLKISEYRLDNEKVDWLGWQKAGDESAVLSWLKERQVELVLVSGFQFILKPTFFNQFAYCLNIHPSLLPDYKGPEPIAWGVLEKQPSFGVTIHQVGAGIDDGDIAAQTAVSRPPIPLFATIESKLADQTAILIQTVLRQINDNQLNLTPQTEKGFYLPTPTLENRQKRINGSLCQTFQDKTNKNH